MRLEVIPSEPKPAGAAKRPVLAASQNLKKRVRTTLCVILKQNFDAFRRFT